MFGKSKRGSEGAPTEQPLPSVFEEIEPADQWEYILVHERKLPQELNGIALEFVDSAGNLIHHRVTNLESIADPSLIQVFARLGRAGWKLCVQSSSLDHFTEGEVSYDKGKSSINAMFATDAHSQYVFRRRLSEED